MKGALSEATARAFVEDSALALQAAALLNGPQEVFDGFCSVRLPAKGRSLAYGAFSAGIATDALIGRAMPSL